MQFSHCTQYCTMYPGLKAVNSKNTSGYEQKKWVTKTYGTSFGKQFDSISKLQCSSRHAFVRRTTNCQCYISLNSSLMISLGAGAWKVSGWPNAMSREEVSMATLEAATTKRQPLTGTVILKNSVEILTWKNTYLKKILMKPPATQQGWRRGSVNPQQSQKGTIDPLWSASKATKHYNASYISPKVL